MTKRKRQLPSAPEESQQHPNSLAGMGNLVLPQVSLPRESLARRLPSDSDTLRSLIEKVVQTTRACQCLLGPQSGVVSLSLSSLPAPRLARLA